MLAVEEIAFLELTQLAELVRTRQVSPVEVTEALLERIERHDPALLSYAAVWREEALADARDAEAEIARGRYRGPLHGVPIAVKDLCYVEGRTTTAGSLLMKDFRAPYNATVVTRLERAGAVILGSLTMTEGAYTAHHPDLPTPVNPWDADTWTGVSSSGSGVATAAGLCFASLGSDTGGSIRLPASANGVTGLKPTWGRVSRHGVFALAPSLDHIGPMARSARDCAAVLGVIAGNDPDDPTSSLEAVPDYVAGIRLERAPRVAVAPRAMEAFDDETRALIASVVETLRAIGWTVTEIELPDLAAVSDAFAPLCAVECATVHADTYPSQADVYGPDLSEFIDFGRSLSAVEYERHLGTRRAFTGRLRRVFQDVDLLLMPGVGFASPTVERLKSVGVDQELLAALLLPTAPFDLAGNPTITLPGGFTGRGTPLGFQFVGPDFSEQLLFQAANAYQEHTDFHLRHPSLV
ncbi:amidase [Streptomyces sp. NPDC005921]|uniref:amidase n=1 Tax=Streptomyces sp. NPDC005827 TaxID=3157070 RepID=UPI0033E0D5EE